MSSSERTPLVPRDEDGLATGDVTTPTTHVNYCSAESVDVEAAAGAGDDVQVDRTPVTTAEKIRAYKYGFGGAVVGVLLLGVPAVIFLGPYGGAVMTAGAIIGFWVTVVLATPRRVWHWNQTDHQTAPLPHKDNDE